MQHIRFVAHQVAFLNELDALGYKRREDYIDSPSDDTLTILTAKMAADINVLRVLALYEVHS